MGRVAAGEPILAEQNIVDEMPVPSRFVGPGNNFILTVSGDSMVNLGINDGDELRRSLRDLYDYNVNLIAVVPVGLTKYRE